MMMRTIDQAGQHDQRVGLRWGILGAATIADSVILPSLRRIGSRVPVVASRDIEKATLLARKHAVSHVTDNYNDVLSHPEVDAVYVPVPNALHFPWTVAALRAGKHVLCEKPICMHASEVRQLIEERDRSGLICAEAIMIVHHPQWASVRRAICSGEIGDIRRVGGAFTYFRADPASIRNNLSLGGGSLRDVGMYPIIGTAFATGRDPVSAQGDLSFSAASGTDTASDCVIDFGDFKLQSFCSTLMGRRQSMVFHGDRGWIEMTAPFTTSNYHDASVIRHIDGDDHLHVEHYGRTQEQYERMLLDFENSVETGAAVAYPLERSLIVQSQLDALLE
ncbi:Gfo/Idh/MocA family oxidoreductase (plasmid) [Paraburkholderia sp. PREW-6R]|uniref:Gfo/Idh/MocA family protein n=1 Tax=Paraburkholderia sp. PREW-6R TaxID=3141544 RepID=UPI0031F5BE13